MNLKQKIQNDLRNALKEKKDIEVMTLRMLNAQVINKEKEKRNKLSKEEGIAEEELVDKSQLNDEEIIDVIFSEVKKRREAILEYEKGNRKDLAEKEKKERGILKKYLPEQLSEEELKNLVKEAIQKVKATEIKDIGKVMAELMPKVKGKAEGGLVSKLIKELLSSTE